MFHCRCMILKPFLYLCFCPSNTACCNFVPSAAVHQTMHISCRYKPFLQKKYPCIHCKLPPVLMSLSLPVPSVDVLVRLFWGCLSRHTCFDSETSAHHYGRCLEHLALTWGMDLPAHCTLPAHPAAQTAAPHLFDAPCSGHSCSLKLIKSPTLLLVMLTPLLTG